MLRRTLVLNALLFGVACAPPTGMTVEFSTNVPCPVDVSTQYLGLAIGGDQAAVERTFTEVFDARQCADGVIGSYSFRPPAGDETLTVNLRAALAPGGNVEHACTSDDPQYDPNQCIVARRRVRFTPGAVLRVPLLFHDSCLGRPCESSETCALGRCVSSTVGVRDCARGDSCVVDDLGGATDGGGGATGGGGGATGGGGGATGGGGGATGGDGGATGGGGGATDGGTATDGGSGGEDAGAIVPIQVVPSSGNITSESGMSATIRVSVMVAPASPVFIPATTTSTEIRIPDGGIWLSPTMTAADFVVTGLDDGLFDGPRAWTVVLGPADSSDPRFLGSDPPDISGTNIDDENGCDVRANQFCGGLPNACCLRFPVDAGLGACTSSCSAGGASTGLAVSCMVSSQCPGEECIVNGTTLACGLNNPGGNPPYPRSTCTSPATCSGLSCADDPTFRIVKTCQCDPLLQQCNVPRPFCDPVGRWCRDSQVGEEFMGAARCPGTTACALENQGCCHRIGTQGCAFPGNCAGILVGCRLTGACSPGMYCSWNKVTDGGLPSKARCVPGFDGLEACQRDAGSSASNCAGGGSCTGVWPQGGYAGELPGYCR